MTTTADRDHELTAYIDGELDPIAALAFERRLAEGGDLARRHEALLALRDRLREALACEPPPHLVARLRAPEPARQASAWRALAASFVLGAALAGTGGWFLGRSDDLARALVADHIRAQLAPQPIDVASSDRHTVRPWLAAHVAQSPEVVDLAGSGFDLVGGRIDMVAGAPVGAMVYRRGPHLISVTALPSRAAALPQAVNGYQIRTWRAGDLTYAAVSDVARADLDRFVSLYRAAAGGGS